jgi:endonuclease III
MQGVFGQKGSQYPGEHTERALVDEVRDDDLKELQQKLKRYGQQQCRALPLFARLSRRTV